MADAAKIIFTEGDAPLAPASGQSAIYAKTDHKFYRKDSTGTELEFGASGDVSTDVIWDAAGDLAVGTGANTAIKLTKGTEGKVLTAGATTLSWETISTSLSSQTPESILANATENTAVPSAMPIAEQTIVGRVTGRHVEDLSAGQVRTLLNVADGATNYAHPTGDGNLHVPANSTTNSGKVLTAGAVAGTYTWETAATGGDVATDTLWDAAGDLVVGTGANTAGKLTKGTEGKVLTAGASTLSWETPSAIGLATSISDGDITHAPDGDTVYHALALKAPLNSPSFTTPTSDMIKFGTAPTVGDFVEGKLYYDNLWKTLSLEAGHDVTLQIGQEEWRRVYNTGAAILNGQSVYSTGVYSGALPHVITVGLAGSATAAESFVLGIATQDIDTNTYGFITVRGNVNGLKTDHAGWTVGDSLYLSETAGLLTNIKPVAPNFEVRVGRIIDVHATLGVINVRITPAYQLDNLSDVAVSGVVANQILKFDGVSWVPADSATTASAGGTNFFLTDSETAIEGLSRANPCIVTWTAHGLVDGGHQVKFEGITQAGWTALNSVSPAANLWHTITIINENSFSIPVNTSGYAAAYVPASDPGIYCTGKLLQTPDGTISESIDAAQSTGNVEALLDTYATFSPLGRTTIEGGEWTFDTWGYASSTTDTNVIVIRVFKRSAAGSETALFNISTADLGTTVTLSRISTIQPAFTILATDHLVVRYFAKSNRDAGAYRQIYLVHGGTTHYSLFKTPLAVAHNQLGGLNTTGYRHLPAAVADSDFAVGQASDGNWIKKTLAETKTILSIPYIHPTGDGNLHVPANSTTNSGKVLTAGSDAGTYTWQTPSVSSLSRLNKTHADTPSAMTAADCSGFNIFTNTGATVEVVMLLPAGADGYRVPAIITAAYDYTFVANGTETIRYLSTVSKAGGSIKSASIGDELQLDWNGTQWVASVLGTSWQLETS